jgi:squalene-hopene/tetraprenyl-beta-curcumene cyclase
VDEVAGGSALSSSPAGAPVAADAASVDPAAVAGRLDAGIDRAADGLLALQRPDGSWKGRLSDSPPATADVVIALRLSGRPGVDDLVAVGVAFLLAAQDADGGWGDDVDDPSTLNGTAFAVAALAIVDRERHADAIARGLARIDAFGGMDAVRDVDRCSLTVLVHFHLAVAGLVEPAGLLRVPVEIALLPPALRRKLTFAMPTAMAWGLMHEELRARPGARRRRASRAGRRALAYLREVERFHGPGGGFVESPMMTANVCIGLSAAGVGADIVERSIAYLRATVSPAGAWAVTRDLEVDATGFVAVGLHDAGRGDDPRVEAARAWIRAAQRPTGFAPTGAPAGGWGWALPSGWPNSGNTAGALMAITRDPRSSPADDAVARAAGRWLVRQQNHDGSWSCFARIGRASVLDPSFLVIRQARAPKALYGPCSVMAAEAVSALARIDPGPSRDRALRRAHAWFARAQDEDGAFANLWYLGRCAGTGSVLRALGDAGLAESGVARRSVSWLRATQNADGGWGDALGRGRSTAEETAMAMLGLCAAGEDPLGRALLAGADHLLRTQRPDGTWDPSLVGVYFLGLAYRHDRTADGYALQALARHREALRRRGDGMSAPSAGQGGRS